MEETPYSLLKNRLFESVILLLFGIPALGIAVPSIFEALNYYTYEDFRAQKALLDCFAILYFLTPVLIMLGMIIVFLKTLSGAFRKSMFIIILVTLIIAGIYFLIILGGKYLLTKGLLLSLLFTISCLLTSLTAAYSIQFFSFNRLIFLRIMETRRTGYNQKLSPNEMKMRCVSFLFLTHILLATCLIYYNALELELGKTEVNIMADILFILAIIVYTIPLLVYFIRYRKRGIYLFRAFFLSWLLIVFITFVFFIPVFKKSKSPEKETIKRNNINSFIQKASLERQSAWIYDSLTLIGNKTNFKAKQLWSIPVSIDSFNLQYNKDSILAVQEIVSCLSILAESKDQKAGFFLLNRLIDNEKKLKQIDSKEAAIEVLKGNDRKVDELWEKVKKLQRTGIYISLISFVLFGLFLFEIKPYPFSKFHLLKNNIIKTRKYCQIILIIALLFFIPLLNPIPRAAISSEGGWPFKLQNWNLKELVSPSNPGLERGGRGGAGGLGGAGGQGGAGIAGGDTSQLAAPQIFFIQGVDTSKVDLKDLIDQLGRSAKNDSAFKQALLNNNLQYQENIGGLHRQLESSINETRNQTSALDRNIDTVSNKLDTSLGNLKDAINSLTRKPNQLNQ